MTGLTPVTFRKERGPRLSAPYVPGRTHVRFWTEEEKEILRAHYPTGGTLACLAHLGPHRDKFGVYNQAHKLGLKKLGSGPRQRLQIPADVDDRIRAAWEAMDPRAKGEIARLAAVLGVPRWWLSKRAVVLGLSVKPTKEPPWTAAEDALLAKVPLHRPNDAARMFRELGFPRTPTAIVVRAKRVNLSRRYTATFSASAAAQILGVDSKSVTALCLTGDLRASRRGTQRLPQQGGDAWSIERAELRRWIVENLGRVDFRKVDKFEFVDLLTRTEAPAEAARPQTAQVAAIAVAAPVEAVRPAPQRKAGFSKPRASAANEGHADIARIDPPAARRAVRRPAGERPRGEVQLRHEKRAAARRTRRRA